MRSTWYPRKWKSLSASNFTSIFVYVCTCVCVYMYVYIYACVYVYVCMYFLHVCKTESTSDTFLYHSSSYFLILFYYFLSQNLFLNLGLIDSARLARQQIPEAPCLYISSTKILCLGCHTQMFTWFSEIKFRSLGLCGEHFPDCVISSIRLAFFLFTYLFLDHHHSLCVFWFHHSQTVTLDK